MQTSHGDYVSPTAESRDEPGASAFTPENANALPSTSAKRHLSNEHFPKGEAKGLKQEPKDARDEVVAQKLLAKYALLDAKERRSNLASPAKEAPSDRSTTAADSVPSVQSKQSSKSNKRMLRRIRRLFKALYMGYVNHMVLCPCYTFPVYSYSQDINTLKPFFSSLGLEEHDVGILYVFFRRIDLDGSGSITIDEMLEYLCLERTSFTKRAFSIFDEDNSGKEFVVALWNYATLTRASLILFTFDLYDKDGSGSLEIAEVKNLLQEVYGNDIENNPHAKYIIVALHERKGASPGMPVYMDVNDFGNFCRRHPATLMPAFMFQEMVRTKICGLHFWSEAQDKRLTLSNGEYIPIGLLLESVINDSVARELLTIEKAAREKMRTDRIRKVQGPRPAMDIEKESAAIAFVKNVGGVLATRRRSAAEVDPDPEGAPIVAGETLGNSSSPLAKVGGIEMRVKGNAIMPDTSPGKRVASAAT